MSSAPHFDVEANALINKYTFGIVREDENGPIEEVQSFLLKNAIRNALDAAETRGQINGMKDAHIYLYEDFLGRKRFDIRISALEDHLASLNGKTTETA